VTTGGLDVVRDFLDVRDVADAYLALVRSDAEGPINVCSGRATSLRTVASFLVDSATVPIGMARDPSLERALDPPHVVGDPGRLTRMTGWSPRITLEESLEDQLDEWRARAGAPTSRQSVAVARAER
jgi:GDP-4-dehydro-6-deoxy-D-mannose reductase